MLNLENYYYAHDLTVEPNTFQIVRRNICQAFSNLISHLAVRITSLLNYYFCANIDSESIITHQEMSQTMLEHRADLLQT